jgi:hypothetical protein
MSQHILETRNALGEHVTVAMGYDRQLDYVFCTVTAGNGELVYSNLSDDDAGTRQQEIDYYRFLLEDFGIEVPESMYQEVESDQLHRVGNRFVVHKLKR